MENDWFNFVINDTKEQCACNTYSVGRDRPAVK